MNKKTELMIFMRVKKKINRTSKRNKNKSERKSVNVLKKKRMMLVRREKQPTLYYLDIHRIGGLWRYDKSELKASTYDDWLIDCLEHTLED